MRIADIIKTSLITAFTIAAALIWKDVIIEIIEVLVPPAEELFYKILTALIATFFIIIAIYLTVKTESEAETLVGKIELLIERLRHREHLPPPPAGNGRDK
jgi:hypothetical protein